MFTVGFMARSHREGMVASPVRYNRQASSADSAVIAARHSKPSG